MRRRKPIRLQPRENGNSIDTSVESIKKSRTMHIRLDSYICIDLETTGIDPESDRIIEIGAVKFEKGVLAGKFSRLVNPDRQLSQEIVDLTGITDLMLKDAPFLEDIKPELESFIGDCGIVVGHNVRFDISFLRRHLSANLQYIVDNQFIDTAALARLVWPGLKGYSLAYLAEFAGLPDPPTHRALNDALATAEIYRYELAALATMPKNIQTIAAGLIFGLALRGAVLSSLEKAAKTLPAPVDYRCDLGDNVIPGIEPERSTEYREIDPDEVDAVFEEKLRALLPDYEERPQQLEMAREVAGAFNRSEFFLAEAPTGIGKSIAYLVGALSWAIPNGESILISTATKNLQDQLFDKDIPIVRKALGREFKAALLKGRANYLCLFKYYELINEAIASFGPEERLALMALVGWAEMTRTGDIAENSGFSPSRWRYLWARSSCEGSFCLGKNCRYYQRCFLFRIKNESQTAQIRVVNHHLMFADFAAGGELLPATGHAILDEAHNLEKIAASYLGPEVNFAQFLTLFNQIFTIKPVETGFLALVKLRALTLDREDTRSTSKEISKAQRVLARARAGCSAFFEKLSAAVAGNDAGEIYEKEISYSELDKLVPASLTEEFIQALRELESALDDLADLLDGFDGLKDKIELSIRARSLVTDIKERRQALEFLAAAADDDYVYWIEPVKKGEARLVCAPLEVGKLLDLKFYGQLKTLVLSSATLSVAGDFGFCKQRLGLDLDSADRTFEKAFDSPFDLKKNISFCGCAFLPPPTAADFDSKAGETILRLFDAARVNGMVLFTAYRNLLSVVDQVGQKMMQSGFELFVQDGSQSTSRLLARFHASKLGVLFGTDSFWEGVDLPGEELELLVIVRLPFAVPDRPWTKANLDRIQMAGGNPFMDYSLPEAVIKFRQGFGRLIRKKTDTGCVVVLDQRLVTREYGKVFAKSLVPPLKPCSSLNELVLTVKSQLENKAHFRF